MVLNNPKVEIIKSYITVRQNYLEVVMAVRYAMPLEHNRTNAQRIAVINTGVDRTFFIGPYGSAFAAGTAEGNGRIF